MHIYHSWRLWIRQYNQLSISDLAQQSIDTRFALVVRGRHNAQSLAHEIQFFPLFSREFKPAPLSPALCTLLCACASLQIVAIHAIILSYIGLNNSTHFLTFDTMTNSPSIIAPTSLTSQQLPVQSLDIQLVVPHPKNTQHHPPAQIRRLRASLKRFGQVKPVVVQFQTAGAHAGHYVLYAGHGVTAAIRELGWQTVSAVLLPPTWDELECKGYLLSDNMRGAEELDELMLEALAEQQAAGVDLLTVGSSDEELAALALQLDTPDGSDEATVTPTMVPSAQAKKQVKPVLYVSDLADFEAAIHKTGLSNRGAALLEVCRHYLRSDQLSLIAPIE